MKKTFLLLFFFSLLGCQSTKQKLIGEWETKSELKNGGYVFYSNNNFSRVINNVAYEESNITLQNGKKVVSKFEIDENQFPMHLDFVLYEIGTKVEIERLKGIFRFLTNSKIEYRIRFDGKRPTKFDNGDGLGTTILYKKN